MVEALYLVTPGLQGNQILPPGIQEYMNHVYCKKYLGRLLVSEGDSLYNPTPFWGPLLVQFKYNALSRLCCGWYPIYPPKLV